MSRKSGRHAPHKSPRHVAVSVVGFPDAYEIAFRKAAIRKVMLEALGLRP